MLQKLEAKLKYCQSWKIVVVEVVAVVVVVVVAEEVVVVVVVVVVEVIAVLATQTICYMKGMNVVKCSLIEGEKLPNLATLPARPCALTLA